MNKHIDILLKIIAFIECLLGLILLSKELIDYVYLPTIQDANNQFGGIVDWFKYKESCYKNFFLYSLLIITGLSFGISKKYYWGLTQVLLITLFFVVIINLWITGVFHFIISICLGTLSLIIFIYLEIKMCNQLFLQAIGISKIIKWLCLFVGVLSCALWLILW
jgi:hypothetical protein